MMGWYGWNGMSGWGWIGMLVSAVVFVGLLVAGGMLLIRYAHQQDRPTPPESTRAAEQTLAERYARGGISDDQFRQQLATLRDAGALTR
jgi:putative membrane protein